MIARFLCDNEFGESDMSEEKLLPLLQELKTGLNKLYGSKLRGVYLFG